MDDELGGSLAMGMIVGRSRRALVLVRVGVGRQPCAYVHAHVATRLSTAQHHHSLNTGC